jgi:hypothetical protein
MGLMFIAAPAHGAGDAVFGINDDNAFRHHYPGSARLLVGLDGVQVGVCIESRHGGYFGVSGGIARSSHGSEAEQAARVQQVMQEARTSPYVAGAFNLLLYDERDLSRRQTGLVRPDARPSRRSARLPGPSPRAPASSRGVCARSGRCCARVCGA